MAGPRQSQCCDALAFGVGLPTSTSMDYNPEILCWNMRGLNNPVKRKAVREFVASVKVNLVCLQETKLDVID